MPRGQTDDTWYFGWIFCVLLEAVRKLAHEVFAGALWWLGNRASPESSWKQSLILLCCDRAFFFKHQTQVLQMPRLARGRGCQHPCGHVAHRSQRMQGRIVKIHIDLNNHKPIWCISPIFTSLTSFLTPCTVSLRRVLHEMKLMMNITKLHHDFFLSVAGD